MEEMRKEPAELKEAQLDQAVGGERPFFEGTSGTENAGGQTDGLVKTGGVIGWNEGSTDGTGFGTGTNKANGTGKSGSYRLPYAP